MSRRPLHPDLPFALVIALAVAGALVYVLRS